MIDEDVLTVDWIHAILDRVVDHYGLQHNGVGRRNPDRFLKELVEDAREIDDPYLKAALFMRRLKNLHVFEDGNKRTGWLAATYILEEYGHEPHLSETDAQTVMKHLNRYSVEDIARWLREGKIDKEKLRE